MGIVSGERCATVAFALSLLLPELVSGLAVETDAEQLFDGAETGPTVMLTVKELPSVGPQLTEVGVNPQDVKPPKLGEPVMGPVRFAFMVTFDAVPPL